MQDGYDMSTSCSENGEEAEKIRELLKESFELAAKAYKDDKAEVKISRTHVKAFLLDLFIGGHAMGSS
ncbi:hypothetical protein Pyn_22896 [Prunus yedoensis var. nudiflora]|uniref:Uncharacterized protein n=1 Tax=Prunus yedoensis var. nudiflora TaxID=2094558 RepID=A0A314YXL7_PRUYE|nr:hypothetical protein Pyn_22896 [Prunus yedoensis var. nudiflora]